MSLFALFPIYWTLKISVTPQNLLYSEGIRFWPSRTTFENFGTFCVPPIFRAIS